MRQTCAPLQQITYKSAPLRRDGVDFPIPSRRSGASGASAALLPSLPAVAVSLGADVDRVLLPLPLPLGSVLALLLGPQHHVGEGHEHLNDTMVGKRFSVRACALPRR